MIKIISFHYHDNRIRTVYCTKNKTLIRKEITKLDKHTCITLFIGGFKGGPRGVVPPQM